MATETEALGLSEVEYVRRAQDGDVEAFGQLVRLYQRRLVSVAYRLLGNIEDARDVSQDAFVRAFRNLAQLEDRARFGAWLVRVVSNLALNFRRARSLRMASSLDSEDSEEGFRESGAGRLAAAGDGDPAHELTGEVREAISKGLQQLPEKQRLALVLFSMEGMPQNEVAEILDCSVELVKWNVFQARKKLKEALADFL